MTSPAHTPGAGATARPDVLVIGSLGMLARDLLVRLESEGFTTLGWDLPEVDITNAEQLSAQLATSAPRMIINCAAYTAVDRAEQEPDLAFAVNRDGPAHLAAACRQLTMPLLHLSTDYVFDGNATRPYREDDPANPLGIYGHSKWQGEEAVRSRLSQHLIVRTAWLYGVHGHNFVKTILRLAREREELQVVADQFGCPTWTGDLAEALIKMAKQVLAGLENHLWGTYHFCGAGQTTWHGFAQAIVEECRKRENLKVSRIIPIATSDYPTAAQRPQWSVLDCGKIEAAFRITPPPWQEGLAETAKEMYEPGRHSG
jgi:dTDP-4-dehydrorhamnose reductase